MFKTKNLSVYGGPEQNERQPSERTCAGAGVEYITDADGLPYQYFWYSPWGETLKEDNATTNSWSSPYRFNGKELDEETGLYYYGARYYNPQISVWLSVDPLHSKSPYQTPYHFVSNNPIIRIDPDGLTDYTVDENGNIEVVPGTETDDFDMLYTKEDYGTDGAKGVKIKDQNILKGMADPNEQIKGSYSSVDSKSGSDMFKAFLFLADNTSVEWSLARGKADGNETYRLSTFREDEVSPYAGNYGMDVIAAVHSHPNIELNNEVSSIGFSPIPNTNKARIAGDFRNVLAGKRNRSYVYFPESTNIRHVTGNTSNPAPVIRQINGDYKRFFFGVLNKI